MLMYLLRLIPPPDNETLTGQQCLIQVQGTPLGATARSIPIIDPHYGFPNVRIVSHVDSHLGFRMMEVLTMEPWYAVRSICCLGHGGVSPPAREDQRVLLPIEMCPSRDPSGLEARFSRESPCRWRALGG